MNALVAISLTEFGSSLICNHCLPLSEAIPGSRSLSQPVPHHHQPQRRTQHDADHLLSRNPGPAAPPNSKREPHDTVELSCNDIDQEIGLLSCELAPPRLNNYQLKSYCVFTPLLPALPYHAHETALSRLILGLPFFSASPVASFCLHTDVTDGHV